LRYSPEENPEKLIIVMSGSGRPLGRINMLGFVPTPNEILQGILSVSVSMGKSPTMVGIDDEWTANQLIPCLTEAGITGGYYPPPSEEEEGHSESASQMGGTGQRDWGQLNRGTKVRLFGLVGSAEYNGRLGHITGSIDRKKGRYPVVLTEGDGKELLLKPDNMLQQILVKHRTTQKRGLVMAKNDVTETYTVDVDFDGVDLASSSTGHREEGEVWVYSDTIIPEQSCVKVINLKDASAAAWNGSRGVIISCDTDKGRYGVQMTSANRISVKFNRVSL